MDHNSAHHCGWCSKPVEVSILQTTNDKGDGVMVVQEMTVASYAYRQGDGTVWHPDCFVKHLAHTDEIRGITR